MSKEDLQKVKEMSKEDVIAKMRSGEIVPPAKGKDRDEFLSFVGMSKEEREKILNQEQNPSDTKVEEGAPVVPPAAAAEDKKAPEPPKDQWWKVLGYESEEKAAEAHKVLVETAARQQSIIDSLNAKEGKRGQDLKRLRDENEKLIKDMEVAKAASAPKIEKPQRPKRPDPKQFEDGALDEKYTAAFAQYEVDLDAYEQKNEVYLTETITRKAAPPVVPPAPVIDNAPWEKLWNNDIPEFQKQHGLVTTVSIKQISDAYHAAHPSNANNNAAEKASANAFLKTVPPADLAAFEKVKDAVDVAYDFSSGVPEPKYKTIAGALFDNGLIGEGKPFNTVVPVRMTAAEEAAARERERQKNQGSATPPPTAAMASGDKNVGDMASVDQKTDRLKMLTQSYNVALNKGVKATEQFESSPEYQEYLNLGRELGYRRK
jgi:hypothetical protein